MNYALVIAASAVLVIFANAADDTTTAAPKKIHYCHVCTSAHHESCSDAFNGSSKFPHEGRSVYNYLRNCDDYDVQPYFNETTGSTWTPKGCRKILQEVETHTRIVRQCAYLEEGGDVQGLKRTGNQGVRLFYYQCSSGDGCNGATSIGAIYLSFLLPAVAAVLARW